MKVKADDNVTVLATYTYGDSNERLIADESGVRTYYDSEGGTVIAEYAESGGSTTPTWSKSYVYLGARLLSTLTPNGSGGAFVQYHHPDRLGTRLVTNGQDTTYFEQVSLPFGTSLNAESTGSTNRRFTSYDRSSATGLDYAINRHYDSQQGRFTQVDPIGMNAASLTDPQSLNMYAYCANDPVNSIDPSGLGFFSFFKKLFKGIWKVLTSKWFVIALTVALAVITIGSTAFGWTLAKTVFTSLGPSGFGGEILIATGQSATTLGWVASGIRAALAIGSISFSARAMLGNVIGFAAGIGISRALGALGGSVGVGGTPEWNPNANGFQTSVGHRGPPRYPTAEAAAIAALSGINRRSRREHREYAGRICQSGGSFIYTTPVQGTRDSSDPNASPCPAGTTTVAGYHTHGGFDPGYRNETFSNFPDPVTGVRRGDIPWANADGHPFYLATPARRIRVYDPATGGTRTLRRRTP